MQVLSRWQNFSFLKTTITQSTHIPLTTYFASFHSTDASYEKWKTKFNFDVGGQKQPPSKDYIRYAVRQKRSATNKALKNLLFNGGFSTRGLEESFSKIEADDADRSKRKSRIKPARQAKRAHNKKVKSKNRKEKSFEDFDEHERKFQEKIAERCFTWTFKPWKKGFDWKETSSSDQFRFKEHDYRKGIEFDNESFAIGAVADRRVLGLPLVGPLRIEDVKAAFRSSALKWHPDKHQGSSQAQAEEKFKDCANAYNSLCSALSTA